MLFQNAESENMFIIAVAIVAGIVFIIMLVTVLALLRSENKIENRARPKDEFQPDLTAVPSSEVIPKERPKFKLEVSQRLRSRIWGISLTIALMFAFNLAVTYLFPINDFGDFIGYFGLILICTTVAAAIGRRIAELKWQETALAVLLFGILLIPFIGIGSFGPIGLSQRPWLIRVGLIASIASVLILLLFAQMSRNKKYD